MPNRYICSVLDEMRECTKTLNFSYLLGLIEEAQTLANRMEAGLADNRGMGYSEEKYQDLRKKVKKLKLEVKELEAKKEFLSDNGRKHSQDD